MSGGLENHPKFRIRGLCYVKIAKERKRAVVIERTLQLYVTPPPFEERALNSSAMSVWHGYVCVGTGAVPHVDIGSERKTKYSLRMW